MHTAWQGQTEMHLSNESASSDTTSLVMGADGLIGDALLTKLRMRDGAAAGSSRRAERQSDRVFMDLACGDIEAGLALAPREAFLCAAITNIRACEDDPVLSARVNVEHTLQLAEALLAQGAYLVFLSSNTVFDGEQERPPEDALLDPVTEYGRQKARAEEALLALPGARERLAIVRLSKVIAPAQGMAFEFLRALRSGQTCRAFSDLRMAPVSLGYVVRGLMLIAEQRVAGVFHLSGAAELGYDEFARVLAQRAGVSEALVDAVSSTDAGVEVLFKPRFPALGMTRTGAVLDLCPEPLEQVLDSLFLPDTNEPSFI